jgi:hypothetical protein
VTNHDVVTLLFFALTYLNTIFLLLVSKYFFCSFHLVIFGTSLA